MKSLLGSALHCKGRSLVKPSTYGVTLVLATLLFVGCQKEAIKKTVDEAQNVNKHSVTPEGNIVDDYGLPGQTVWELQQARAATARYRNIENAKKDGYSNI